MVTFPLGFLYHIREEFLKFASAFSLTLLTVCVSFAQLPQSIIVGTVYNIFHEEFATDEEFFHQVDKDVALMKESNITHVMIFPMSEWDPETKQLRWTRTDYLVKKIEAARLKFIPLMLKEEQCSHYFPIWKFKEIKGLWQERNVDNGNKNNRQDVDFADPRIYPLLEEYFRQVIGRYGTSPALSFYNIWNEPHYHSDAEHVVERFRGWLQRKYGTIGALRRAWGKEYVDWSEVSPFLADNWNSSMPQIDWAVFRSELDGDLMAQLVSTLRKYDKDHPVNANPVSTPWANFGNFGSYNVDGWAIAEHEDIHGISYYPDGWEREHNLEPCPYWLHNLAFNTIRSGSGEKNFILTEVYTNAQNGLALNGYLTPDQVKDLAWTALSNDCKGMIYWKWLPFMRGRQSLGRGLCQVDGDLAPRGEAVKEIGAVMQKYGKLIFNAHLKKAKAAILVDIVGLLKCLEQGAEPSTNKFMYESNAGVFKALYESNISVDMVRMDRPLSLETLKKYKIVYLPFQIVMRKQTAELLKAYVRQGGWIVADARTATLDELDFAYRVSPGAGLDELFGATRPDWTGGKTYYKIHMSDAKDHPAFDFDGRYFRDKLQVNDEAEIMGTFVDNGEPAMIRHRYGMGTAILSAVPLGASYYDRPNDPANRILVNAALDAGAAPDARFIAKGSDFLSLKVHVAGSNLIVYAINSEARPVSGTISANTEGKRIATVTNLITGKGVVFVQNEQGIEIPAEASPYEVSVYLLEH